MRRVLMLGVGLALVLCISTTAAQVEPTKPDTKAAPVIVKPGKVENPPEKLQIAYKLVDGQVNRYQVQVTSKGTYRLLNSKKEQTLDTVTDMQFRQSVKAAEEGLYKVQWSLQSGAVTMPKFGVSDITLPDMVYTMDDSGVVTKVTGIEKLALLPGKPQQKSLATMFGQMSFQGFPKKALKVGDEWTKEYTVAIGENEKITAKTTSKLVGYEKCDGFDCAKIETKYDYPIKLDIVDKANGKLRLEGRESAVINTRFAYTQGKMIRTEAEIKTDAKVTKIDDKAAKADAKATEADAKATKTDASGDAFVKLQLKAVSSLVTAKADTSVDTKVDTTVKEGK